MPKPTLDNALMAILNAATKVKKRKRKRRK